MATSYNKSVNKQMGFSLVELMVALGLITTVAFIIAQFSTSFQSRDTGLRRACESYTASLIGVVQEETPFREIIDFLPVGPGPANKTPPGFTRQTRAVPNVDDYGPVGLSGGMAESFMINALNVGNPTAVNRGVRLQSFQLIQGSVRSLATIYNRNPAIRCQFGTYNPITSNAIPIPTVFLNNPGAQVRMRVDPYSISTGASLCPTIGSNLLFPGPRAASNIAVNTAMIGSGLPNGAGYPSTYLASYNLHESKAVAGAEDPASPPTVPLTDIGSNGSSITNRRDLGPVEVGDPNLGLRLTVEMTYTQDGQNYSCQTSHGFEFPVDQSLPPVPQVVVTTNESILSGANARLWDHCEAPTGSGQSNNSGDVQIQIGLIGSATSVEPGIQFLCKDLSWIREPETYARCVTRGSNSMGTTPAGQFINQPMARSSPPSPSNPIPSGYPTLTLSERSRQFTSRNGGKDLRHKEWVPCDRLVQCGVAPNPTRVQNANNRFYQLEYSTLPFGCHINTEVVSVDTAGNRSPATSPIFVVGGPHNMAVANTSVTFRAWMDELYHPTCGPSTAPGGGTYYVAGLGMLCPPNNDGSGIDYGYPNPYYTCRAHPNFGHWGGTGPNNSCCRGTGCRPWN